MKKNIVGILTAAVCVMLCFAGCDLGLESSRAPEMDGQTRSLSGIKSVACGYYYSLALTYNNSLVVTGDNRYGQLGKADIGGGTSQWTRVLNNVSSFAAGMYHSLAVKKDGTLWVTGYNSHGQLGTNSFEDISEWQKVAGMNNVKYVAAGAYHSLAIKNDGTLWAAGWGTDGQLGFDSTTGKEKQWVNVTGTLKSVKSIAAGYNFSLVLKSNGTLFGAGANYNYELGLSEEKAYKKWTKLLKNVTGMAAGYSHSVAVRSDYTLWGTGDNYYGQLGWPRALELPGWAKCLDKTYHVSAGAYHTMAHRTEPNRALYIAGRNNRGQQGDGGEMNNYLFVQAFDGDAVNSAGGYEHSLALVYNWSQRTHVLYVTGYNNFGQLGVGDRQDRNTWTK